MFWRALRLMPRLPPLTRSPARGLVFPRAWWPPPRKPPRLNSKLELFLRNVGLASVIWRRNCPFLLGDEKNAARPIPPVASAQMSPIWCPPFYFFGAPATPFSVRQNAGLGGKYFPRFLRAQQSGLGVPHPALRPPLPGKILKRPAGPLQTSSPGRSIPLVFFFGFWSSRQSSPPPLFWAPFPP